MNGNNDPKDTRLTDQTFLKVIDSAPWVPGEFKGQGLDV